MSARSSRSFRLWRPYHHDGSLEMLTGGADAWTDRDQGKMFFYFSKTVYIQSGAKVRQDPLGWQSAHVAG